MLTRGRRRYGFPGTGNLKEDKAGEDAGAPWGRRAIRQGARGASDSVLEEWHRSACADDARSHWPSLMVSSAYRAGGFVLGRTRKRKGFSGSRRGTIFHMEATINIPDALMRKPKEEAARRGTTISALVEAGLRTVLGGTVIVTVSVL